MHKAVLLYKRDLRISGDLTVRLKWKSRSLRERVFYICGPPKMVDALRAVLSDELTIDKEKIRFEHFTGC